MNVALHLSMISKEFWLVDENMMIVNHVNHAISGDVFDVFSTGAKVTSKALLRSGQRSQAQEVSQSALEQLETLKGQGSPKLGGGVVVVYL